MTKAADRPTAPDRPLRWAWCLALFAALFGTCRAAEEFRIGGAGAALGTMRLLADAFNAIQPDIRITVVPSLGSHGGIRAVIGGSLGLAVTSRPIDEEERKLAIVAVEYSRTPFVFAVSTRTPITGVTSGELADIYAGRKTRWADGTPIRIVLRPERDTDSVLIRNMSSDMAAALTLAANRPGMPIAPTDQHAADEIERIPGAIGPTSLTIIVSENRHLRALSLDGREPTVKNAAEGTYPLHKRQYLVWSAKRPPAVERFVAFVRSSEGRKIIAANGQWVP